MRLLIACLLSTLAIGITYGQGVVWEKCYYIEKFPGAPQFGRTSIYDGQLSKNGGILAVGPYWAAVTSRFALNYFKAIRVSSAGDSLGTHRLPGFATAVPYKPSFIGTSQLGKSLVLCPTDTFKLNDSITQPSYIAVLDTSGLCRDSFALDSPEIIKVSVPEHGTQFSSTSAILTSSGYDRDISGNGYQAWHVWKVRIPEGYLEWHKSLRPNIYFAEGCKAVIMPLGKIWVYGVAGASIAVVKLDSLGNQTGFQILYTTPTSVKPVLGSLVPLPGGKLGLSVGYNPTSPNYGNKPGASLLMIMDTLGNPDWQISKRIPPMGSAVDGFAQIYGANLDGSINYVRDSSEGRYYFLEKRSADSTLLYSWPLYTKGDVHASKINGVVYAGSEEAYVYENGYDYINNKPGDYVAKVTGFGDPYVPTAIKARGGPRAPISAVLYPNPAQGFVQLQIEKSMPYKILTITGAVVQEGIASPKVPIDIAALPPALYQLFLSDGQQKVVKRFVKH